MSPTVFSRIHSTVGRALASPWALPVLVVAAAIIALASEHFVYPATSWNRDESVYQWQTDLLTSGRLTFSDMGFPEATQPWLTGHRDGVFFSQYPLGWPVVLLAGRAVGWPALSLAFAAGLAVAGTYVLAHELTRDRRVAALSGAVLLCSPIVAVQSGTYLTYLFAMGLGTLFTTNFLAGVRTGSRRRVAAAGFLLGWLVITRTFDAVIWAAAVGGCVAVVERRAWRRHFRLVPVFLASLVPLVAVQLIHNRYLTGSPLEFPMTVADPLDTFGFGERRIMPGMDKVDYRISTALRSTLKNAFFVPWFLFGAHLGVALAIVGIVVHRRHRSTWLLVAIGLTFALGYFSFWGMSVSALTSRMSGPIYYIGTYSVLAILVARGLIIIARRAPVVALSCGALCLALSIGVGAGRVALNHHASRVQKAWAEATSTVEQPAVVVVSPSRYLFQLNPWAGNTAEVGGSIIWATDRDPSVIDLIDAHPERRAYIQRPKAPTAELLPTEQIDHFEVETVPVQITRSAVVEVPVTTRARRDGAVSIALVVNGETFWRDLTADAEQGETVTTTFTLVANDGPPIPGGLEVEEGDLRIAFLAGFGTTPEQARANPVLRHTLLAMGGRVLRVMQPGTTWRPDANIDDRLVWRDDQPTAELTVDVRAAG